MPRRGGRTLARLLFALVVGGGVACGGDSTATTRSVTAVVLTGTPTAPMRVGGTTQLLATALSETGSTISGAAVTWTSTNQAVARVSSGGLVTAISAGAATVTATSGSGTAQTEILVVAPLALSSGNSVALPDGSVTLASAPGGTGGMTLLVGPGAASTADDKVVPGSIFQISSESGTPLFLGGVTLTLRYDPARMPAGTTAGGLQLYQRTGTGWVAIRQSASNETQRTVSGTFQTTGTYAARYTPVARVLITGAQADGALYVGQTGRISAAAESATGEILSRGATWTSSAESIVAVIADGTLTAKGTGTATITATVDGATATTQVLVLVRPTASWAGTLDWTTHRGNNRRTGFVDAALDPLTFSRRWEVTVSGNGQASLSEPATGDGNVYVSSKAYYGSQALWALDAMTGAARWTRAFGEIHAVNGPATGNGRVYVSTGGHQDSFLWSFEAADGTVKYRSAYGNQWSRWNAPAVTPDVVFVAGGYYGGMSSFGALDGALRWRRDLSQEDEWTPAADGNTAYVFGSSGLLTLDGTSGTAAVKLASLGLPSAGTPVIGSVNELFAIRGSRLIAMDLARNAMSWSLPGSYQGVPTVDATNVYAVVNGQVEARRRTDGALAWTWVPQSGTATGSVIVTRNLLFVRLVPSVNATSGGRVAALDLSVRKVVWSYDADGELALGNGLLVVASRTGTKVTAISVR